MEDTTKVLIFVIQTIAFMWSNYFITYYLRHKSWYKYDNLINMSSYTVYILWATATYFIYKA